MISIDLNQVGCNKKLSLGDSVIASFITGSFVNGYFRDDSDIDVVAVYKEGKESIEDLDERLSLHTLNEPSLKYFERAKFYSVLRNVPLYNSGYVTDLSSRTKKEMVKEESKRLIKLHKKQDRNQVVFTPWEIISRHFTRRWGIVEPSRLIPLERMLNSSKSRGILEQEYTLIFEELSKSGFLIKVDEGYSISKNAVLNEDRHQILSPMRRFGWAFRESRAGLLYLASSPEIIRNVRSYYFPK